MEELVRISSAVIDGEMQSAVDARELWRKLGSKQDFSTWMKDRLKGFKEMQDFTVHKNVDGRQNRGWFSPKEYTLTLDTAKHIAMLERNEMGRKIRQYFIECERELRRRHTMPMEVATLYATLENEIRNRIEAEYERDRYRDNLRRLSMFGTVTDFGALSDKTGLPKDIVVAPHCKSSSRHHTPQYDRFVGYVQLFLPFSEDVEAMELRLKNNEVKAPGAHK